MRWTTRPLTPADIRDITGWQYAAPYDTYDPCGPLTESLCRALCDEREALLGFFCWGEEARVEEARDVYEADPASLDIGLGLRPALLGMGQGLFAFSAALSWLQKTMRPTRFRLAVYEWNVRAMRVYRRAGFAPLTRRGNFVLMLRDERPWRDATRPLQNGMHVYPGDPAFDRRLLRRKEDCGWNLSVFSMSAHSGTHLDAPAHIGLPGDTNALPLEALHGSMQLLQWQTPDFAAIRSPRVLLKTGGRGLSLPEAERLLSHGVTMIGLDGMSAGEGDTEWAVHALLLGAGVIIVENAALEDFAPGWYEARCLPLSLPGSDGAPVRFLLREEGLC